MSETKHAAKPEERKDNQESQPRSPEGIVSVVREQYQRPTGDSHPSPPRPAEANHQLNPEVGDMLGKVQFYDSAREGDRQRGGRESGERSDATRLYGSPENYYGKVNALSDAQMGQLWSRSSIVLDANEVRSFQQRAEQLGLTKGSHSPHIDAYMSSRGFSTQDERNTFLQLLNNGGRGTDVHGDPINLGLDEKTIQALKARTWKEGDTFQRTGSDQTYDASRLDESNPALHEAYKKYLAAKVRGLPEGVGVFVDDADMSDLINKRQAARGNKVPAENPAEADKYQNAIDNHVDTLHAMVQVARERQGTVVINRGQELTQENWTAWDRDGRKTTDQQGNAQEGWQRKEAVCKQLSEITAGTTKVMFESVGVGYSHQPTDAGNLQEIVNYREVMRKMMGPNADEQRSIEYTAYVNPNPGTGERKEAYFSNTQNVEQALGKLFEGMSPQERNWAAEHMVVNTYPHRGLEKSPSENPVQTYKITFVGEPPSPKLVPKQ